MDYSSTSVSASPPTQWLTVQHTPIAKVTQNAINNMNPALLIVKP